MTRSFFVLGIVSALVFVGAGCGDVQTVWDEVEEGAQNVYESFDGDFFEGGDDEIVTELSRVEGMLVQGDGFSMEVPEDWIVDASSFTSRSSTGMRTHGWIANGVSNDAYGDPDIITITIKDLEKDDQSFDEIVELYGWDESDIDARVEFMREHAHENFWITAADVSVVNGAIEMNDGSIVSRSELRCLKTCYIEGSASTIVEYFVETEELVYKITVSVATNETTDAFLEEAEEVIKTFVAK